MRTEFVGECQEEKIINGLRGILPDSVTISLNNDHTKDVVLLATKEHHCLSDLLIRNEFKDLNINILAVVANHETLGNLVKKFNVPFHFVSHDGKSREQHESEVLSVVKGYKPE